MKMKVSRADNGVDWLTVMDDCEMAVFAFFTSRILIY